jgi:hypothetical protein
MGDAFFSRYDIVMGKTMRGVIVMVINPVMPVVGCPK